MKEMILDNAKMEGGIVHCARFAARWQTNGVVEYARNSAENAKDMLDCSDSVYLCNPTGLR